MFMLSQERIHAFAAIQATDKLVFSVSAARGLTKIPRTSDLSYAGDMWTYSTRTLNVAGLPTQYLATKRGDCQAMDLGNVFYPVMAALLATFSALGISTAIGRQIESTSIEIDLAVLLGVIVGLIDMTYLQPSWLY